MSTTDKEPRFTEGVMSDGALIERLEEPIFEIDQKGRPIPVAGMWRADMREAAAALKAAEAASIVAPAECDPNCDDPHCPYSHQPLTLRQAYENSLVRLRKAEADLAAARAEIERLTKKEPK
jgi:hypothetical protein